MKSSKFSSWQVFAVIGLVLLLLVIGVFKEPRKVIVNKTFPAIVRKTTVVVSKQQISQGEKLDISKFALEDRYSDTLPSDVLTSLNQVKNKVAVGVIPAGYPLARGLIHDYKQKKAEKKSSDLDIESILATIKKNTVAIPMKFNPSPKHGSRITVTMKELMTSGHVLIEDAWVEVDKNSTVLLVNPTQSFILGYAQSYGGLSFLELPLEGKNPYEGKGIHSIDQLKNLLAGKIQPEEPRIAQESEVEDSREKKIKGYAWIPGDAYKYSIDEDGTISMQNK